jgi:5-methylthioadenosine/S-adenosylhomocysteine deaminase
MNNHASTGRTLFRGVTVLTLDPHLGDFPKGYELVEGARIAAVGPDLKVDNAEIVDARVAIVLPGLVDAHRDAASQIQMAGRS